MKETPQQYTQRMLGNVGQRPPLKVQAATARKLERLIKGVPTARLRRPPAPGKWSVQQILAHLADTEIAAGWRLRLILGAPGTPIHPFDQDAWASAGHYDQRDPRQSLATFAAMRAANLALLKSLTPEQWKHQGIHAERGPESVEHIAKMFAGHDLNHLGQVEKILAGKK